jgi:hypothetical protein
VFAYRTYDIFLAIDCSRGNGFSRHQNGDLAARDGPSYNACPVDTVIKITIPANTTMNWHISVKVFD